MCTMVTGLVQVYVVASLVSLGVSMVTALESGCFHGYNLHDLIVIMATGLVTLAFLWCLDQRVWSFCGHVPGSGI